MGPLCIKKLFIISCWISIYCGSHTKKEKLWANLASPMFGTWWHILLVRLDSKRPIYCPTISSDWYSFLWMQSQIPFLPVFSSMKRLMRYSLGSVALGSLIVSFVGSSRFILEGIRRKLKVSNTVPESRIGMVAYHSSQFCRRCIDWTLKSVNRNAYIMVISWNFFPRKSMCLFFFPFPLVCFGFIWWHHLRPNVKDVHMKKVMILSRVCFTVAAYLFFIEMHAFDSCRLL